MKSTDMFIAVLTIFSLAALALGICILVFCRREDLLPAWEKIPRAKKSGIVLTALAILWCVPHIRPILEPNSALQDYLLPAAVIAIILCSIYLDYLVSRSVAALLILTAHFFLQESFALHAFPVSAFFAAGIFVFGCAGIVSGIKPWWMRDWIRMLFQRPRIRYVSAGILFYIGLTGLLLVLMAPKG